MSPECRKTRAVPQSLNIRILFRRVGITSGIQPVWFYEWTGKCHLTKVKLVRCIKSHMIPDNEIYFCTFQSTDHETLEWQENLKNAIKMHYLMTRKDTFKMTLNIFFPPEWSPWIHTPAWTLVSQWTASGWAMICPSAPRCPSSATPDTGWATTSRLFARRTTFGVTRCPPVMVSAPVELKSLL